MTIDFAVPEEIERLIRLIEHEYRHCKGLILTEADLASLIYAKLKGKYYSRYSGEHNWHLPTMDPHIFASPVHLEVPWYDSDHKLTIRPDITILDTSQLSILHSCDGGLRLPSKGCEFGGDSIIMELKFIRNMDGITQVDLQKIVRDFNKINSKLKTVNMNSDIRGSIYCFFIIFNKTDIRCSEFDQFLSEHSNANWYKYLYCTGQVSTPSPTPSQTPITRLRIIQPRPHQSRKGRRG